VEALGVRPARAAQLWQAYTYWGSPNVPAAQGFQHAMDDIEKSLNGELKLKMNLGGSLSINMANIGAAVGDDIIQIAHDAIWDGAFPMGALIALPSLIQGSQEMVKVMEVMGPHFTRSYADRGVTALGYYVYPAQVIWSRDQVASLADLKGRKVRVGSSVQVEFMRRFGATGITMGSAEVAAALERGLVNAVVTASAGGVTAWKELLKSSYRLPINFPVSWIIVNTDRFNGLPEASQAKIRGIVEKDMAQLTATLEADDKRLTEKFGSEGITINQASDADKAAAAKEMTSFWVEWAQNKGPEAVELLKRIREIVGR
jgi:TRAP-type C4-dicarboxylate transport system substrate-binding protein